MEKRCCRVDKKGVVNRANWANRVRKLRTLSFCVMVMTERRVWQCLSACSDQMSSLIFYSWEDWPSVMLARPQRPPSPPWGLAQTWSCTDEHPLTVITYTHGHAHTHYILSNMLLCTLSRRLPGNSSSSCSSNTKSTSCSSKSRWGWRASQSSFCCFPQCLCVRAPVPCTQKAVFWLRLWMSTPLFDYQRPR